MTKANRTKAEHNARTQYNEEIFHILLHFSVVFCFVCVCAYARNFLFTIRKIFVCITFIHMVGPSQNSLQSSRILGENTFFFLRFCKANNILAHWRTQQFMMLFADSRLLFSRSFHSIFADLVEMNQHNSYILSLTLFRSFESFCFLSFSLAPHSLVRIMLKLVYEYMCVIYVSNFRIVDLFFPISPLAEA